MRLLSGASTTGVSLDQDIERAFAQVQDADQYDRTTPLLPFSELGLA